MLAVRTKKKKISRILFPVWLIVCKSKRTELYYRWLAGQPVYRDSEQDTGVGEHPVQSRYADSVEEWMLVVFHLADERLLVGRAQFRERRVSPVSSLHYRLKVAEVRHELWL